MNCKVHGVVKNGICLVLTLLLLCGVLWHVPDRGNIFFSLVRIDHLNVSFGGKEFGDLRLFLQIFSFCQTVNQCHFWVLTLVECIDTYMTMYLIVPVMLKKLDGQQNTHQIFLKFLYIMLSNCLSISNREKKPYYILSLKFDDFAISQWYMYYRDLHHKEIKIVQKWPGHSNPLKFIQFFPEMADIMVI